MSDIPEIKIKKDGGISTFKKETKERFKEINTVLIGVIVILLVMVATLIIDSFHINSATYREYSEKINTLNSMKEINSELLKQNKENQELILKQQNQILELLNKK